MANEASKADLFHPPLKEGGRGEVSFSPDFSEDKIPLKANFKKANTPLAPFFKGGCYLPWR